MNRLRHLWLTLRLEIPPLAWVTLALSLALLACRPLLDREQRSLDARRVQLEREITRLPKPRQVKPAAPSRPATREQRVAQVFALFDQQGLASRQVIYRYSEDGVLTLDLALEAAFPQINATLRKLAGIPGVRIHRITLAREAMQGAQLKIALQLSLTGGT